MSIVHQETINMRTTVEQKARLRRAAELRNTSLSQFILDAAADRADKVISEHQLTTLPGDFFDAFFATLAQPPASNPALEALAAMPRPYQQR